MTAALLVLTWGSSAPVRPAVIANSTVHEMRRPTTRGWSWSRAAGGENDALALLPTLEISGDSMESYPMLESTLSVKNYKAFFF
jgi:hypothetical protein